jgi:hypothetical protein
MVVGRQATFATHCSPTQLTVGNMLSHVCSTPLRKHDLICIACWINYFYVCAYRKGGALAVQNEEQALYARDARLGLRV